jgi:hypothetical protein
MIGYEDDIIKLYGVQGAAATPATSDLFYIDPASKPLSADRAKEFHSMVAKLLFFTKRVKVNCLTAVVFLATRVQHPSEQDWSKLDRTLRYIKATRGEGIILTANDGMVPEAHVDASFAVHNDAKSHTGLYITLGKGPIFVRSAKQTLVSKSSTEAELIALSDSVGQIVWTRDFVMYQGYKIGAVIVYQDNKSTIALIEKGKSTAAGTRHINIRYFFVKNRVELGDIRIVYLFTLLIIADFFTKALQGAAYRTKCLLVTNWWMRKSN